MRTVFVATQRTPVTNYQGQEWQLQLLQPPGSYLVTVTGNVTQLVLLQTSDLGVQCACTPVGGMRNNDTV